MVIRIAVDAMGGDYAPREVVHGAVLAAREYGVKILLVGPPEIVAQELRRHSTTGLDIKLVPASEIVDMDENPSRAVLRKKDSSIVVATKQVAEGHADAVVAAGSTGAAAVSAQINLGRIPTVDRAPIACMMPTVNIERPALVLDVGANKDCDAQQLLQFALMGSLLYEGLLKVKSPRVGLLNIGTEESKGTKLVQDAYKLLKASNKINFIGFVEGRDFPLGKCDVTVTDGFTGNNVLKTAEGIARMITIMMKQEMLASVRTKIGAKISEPAFANLRKRIDYNEFGGALLLGVKGVYVIAHGGSKHTAIKNAIRVARDMIQADVQRNIEEALALVTVGTKS
ncbi:MAG: phosphate acyltransferase PlsX [Candidatus Obscuribacterales bacterium]|nr:phosphate acyltransferase PlsX [Candidatus Obscuribacterales bacterium]